MPRRSVLLSCLVAVASQVSSGCCGWRPFAHCWHGCGPSCVPTAIGPGPGYGVGFGGPAGCASCMSSPVSAGPVMAGPPPMMSAPPVVHTQGMGVPAGTLGMPQVIGQSVSPGGSVFTGPPTTFGTPPTISPVPAPIR